MVIVPEAFRSDFRHTSHTTVLPEIVIQGLVSGGGGIDIGGLGTKMRKTCRKIAENLQKNCGKNMGKLRENYRKIAEIAVFGSCTLLLERTNKNCTYFVMYFVLLLYFATLVCTLSCCSHYFQQNIYKCFLDDVQF